MALNDILKLRAQAKAKGVSGYKTMSADELKKALGSSNGSGTKTAAKTAVSRATAKGTKTAVKSAGRKTASVKSAPAKTAKRQTTGARKSAPAKSAPRSTAKTAKANGVSKDYHGGRNLISNSDVDWTKEWNVGGIRGEIFKALKKFKGDTNKVYDALAPRATEFWKKNRAGERILKDRALEILRWNISRVKFDYVIATKQHKTSKKFGTLGTGRGTPKKAAPARKSTRTAPKAQKTSQSRAGAKKTTGRKTAGRK